ncbi:unnamed protein product [Chondrus crispus]|uniref:Uncharacterized protein n=1 Tax=Chondrus crispus TaxID=2769 RepID=R7QGT5_CHOCR|nr:unnamed protein product [Chondrus crispus]CDF37732.1 unnamed protein product [Chondrus crispus]|eukprot:XP_005717603.1 unnamed protein product [Chondrus crispus]
MKQLVEGLCWLAAFRFLWLTFRLPLLYNFCTSATLSNSLAATSSSFSNNSAFTRSVPTPQLSPPWPSSQRRRARNQPSSRAPLRSPRRARRAFAPVSLRVQTRRPAWQPPTPTARRKCPSLSLRSRTYPLPPPRPPPPMQRKAKRRRICARSSRRKSTGYAPPKSLSRSTKAPSSARRARICTNRKRAPDSWVSRRGPLSKSCHRRLSAPCAALLNLGFYRRRKSLPALRITRVMVLAVIR